MSKKLLKTLIKPVKYGLESLFGLEALLAEWWAAAAYRRVFFANWQLPPRHDLFLHKINLFWEWRKTRNAGWLERGIYSLLAIRHGAKVLELCCGDGFNAYYFYSGKAGSVLAVDIAAAAIRYAKRHFRAPNLTFEIADIRHQMPAADFDNIVCDVALEYFPEDDIHALMPAIRERLAARTGTFSGHVLLVKDEVLRNHRYRFTSKDDLKRFLAPHFRNVTVFETIFPERHNMYFWASDGALPLRENPEP